jgi:vacuolar-type H+-ATPase subunit F/Vma7
MSMPESPRSDALAVVGREEVIMGFSALGFRPYPAVKPEECREALARAIQDGAAICLIQEEFYPAVREEINRYRSQPLPIFIPFAPDARMNRLDDIVKEIRLKATGVD